MRLLHANDTVGEHAPSWYSATTPQTNFTPLKHTTDTDVCIVGGGYTGLSTALHLAKAGIDVVVLEAHRVGWGASGRNGGQLGSGFNMGQDSLEAQLGVQTARHLWQFCEDAKTTIKTICQQHAIDIDYQPGVVYALHRKRFLQEHHAYCDKLRKDYQYEQMHPLDKSQLEEHVGSKIYHGGSVDLGAGHIHPLKLAHGLAKAATESGAVIHELSQVNSIDYQKGCIKLDAGTVNARHIVLACNGYLDELNTQFARRVFPINNFMIATEPLGERARELLPFNEAVADSRFVVNYYRLSNDGRMLFGGGENYGYRFPAGIEKNVRRTMLKIFPQLQDCKIDYAWGGTLAITPTRLPVVMRLDERTMASGGYSGHGVALSSMCAKAMAEAILGDTTRFNLLQTLPNRAFTGNAQIRPAIQIMAMTAAKILDMY